MKRSVVKTHPTTAMPFRRFLIYWLPVILYCLLIFIQSALPPAIETEGVPMGDKFLHLAAYLFMAALFFRALKATRPMARPIWLWTASVLFTILYGASDEIHQSFVPARSADILDFLADAAGAVIGAAAAAWLEPRMTGFFQKINRLTNP